MDLACLLVGGVVGVMLRFGHEEMTEYVFNHLEGWLLLFGGVLLANYLAGSYRLQYTFSRFNLVVTWMFSLTFALLILSVTSYAWFIHMLGRGVLFFSLACYSVLSLFLKLLVYQSLFRSEALACRTVVLGTGSKAVESIQLLENRYVLPAHKVVACIRVSGGQEETASPRPSVLEGSVIVDSTPADLEDVIRSLDVNLIVIAFEDHRDESTLYPQLRRLRFHGVEVLSRLALAETYSGRTPLDLMDEEFLMQASMESQLPMVWRVKRLFDICFSALASVLLAPLLLAVSLLLKVASPRSPVFYSQIRTGRFGKPFRIYKIRTMRHGAEKKTGPVWAHPDDPRITAVGRILRRFRVDEIPQFLNILRGEMSLVGPRPERPEITAKLTEEIPYYAERENVMPGITGWAQIRYPYGRTVEDARHKLEYDLYYIKHHSPSLDLQIILSTLRIVLLGGDFQHPRVSRGRTGEGDIREKGVRDGEPPASVTALEK